MQEVPPAQGCCWGETCTAATRRDSLDRWWMTAMLIAVLHAVVIRMVAQLWAASLRPSPRCWGRRGGAHTTLSARDAIHLRPISCSPVCPTFEHWHQEAKTGTRGWR